MDNANTDWLLGKLRVEVGRMILKDLNKSEVHTVRGMVAISSDGKREGNYCRHLCAATGKWREQLVEAPRGRIAKIRCPDCTLVLWSAAAPPEKPIAPSDSSPWPQF